MSPFDRSYQPVVQLGTKADLKSSQMSAHKTAKRAKDLESDDPKVRAAARKKLSALSKRSQGA